VEVGGLVEAEGGILLLLLMVLLCLGVIGFR
jgi:hypothetical protein